MKIGVTGTRNGMTPEQEDSFVRFISEFAFKDDFEFHHGDCVGVDDQSADLVDDFRSESRNWKIVCHPPEKEELRAFNGRNDEVREPKSHFARNRDIVDVSDIVVVIPKQSEWCNNGGTWYTHDYAVKKKKRVVIIWPDGALQDAYYPRKESQ